MLIEKLFILFKIALKGGHKMEIGNKINQLRKLSGMTQEQLAENLTYPDRLFPNGSQIALPLI